MIKQKQWQKYEETEKVKQKKEKEMKKKQLNKKLGVYLNEGKSGEKNTKKVIKGNDK